MGKKKSKQPLNGDQAEGGNGATGSSTATISTANLPAAQGSNPGSKSKTASPADTGPALIICRNKHWRYISSFHGPWLQMPIEILETIANINFNTPRPRPIDPAVLFDLLKIRRLVDEATNLAVRAASDVASPTLTNVHGGLNGHNMTSLGFGIGGPQGTKLSKERKFRMREQASQKLARAYRLDEIACSVATMQGASPLEEIGSLVLHRNRDDPDAKYVHFFHEKIPSRQLAECTSLQPLNEIIAARPTEGEALRTRATVRIFKEDYEGAAQDLTMALQVYKIHRPTHNISSSQELQLCNGSKRQQDIILTEEQQPSSLETQLLFQRAGVYLTMACQHVTGSLPGVAPIGSDGDAVKASGVHGKPNDHANVNGNTPDGPTPAEREALKRNIENRKIVKTYAKRALRDYMLYLSHFDYTPDIPLKVAKEFIEKVNSAAQGTRYPRATDSGIMTPDKIYPLSDLFAAVPPTDIPTYPSNDLVHHSSRAEPRPSTYEAITYHPLLTDALHSLLLCHCLVQTSAKELLRHAYMVARLARLADGYPVFQASRSPARADWIEVLRRADNWISVTSSWEQLCAPAPLPLLDAPLGEQITQSHPSPSAAAFAAASVTRSNGSLAAAGEDEEQRKERIRQQAIMESLEDDRVVDEATLRAAITARQKRAEADHDYLMGLKNSNTRSESNAYVNTTPAFRRWSVDDGREYPILTERAAAIACWVLEAPIVSAGTKRKKKPASTKLKGTQDTTDDMAYRISKLDVKEDIVAVESAA